MQNDTIAAISTPHGRGGIAVIRISGEGAIACASGFFSPRSGGSLTEVEPNRAVYGSISYENKIIDDGIAVVFRAPRSFTGEDTVEISCHGGILLTERVLASAFKNGARAAQAGEFTKRAFLSGKLSLTEAEAVIELINAENEEKLLLSSASARGVLSGELDAINQRLVSLAAQAYVTADYPDEELSELSPEEAKKELRAASEDISALSATYRRGHAVAEGIKTAIIGAPNAGKSSLLNSLLGRERAIVSPLAGTTRDTVEERLNIGGVTLILCDTAGIREGGGEIEKMGIERTRAAIEESELILCVIDGSLGINPEAEEVLASIPAEKTVIAVINKSDLFSAPPEIGGAGFADAVTISAKSGDGIAALREKISALFDIGEIDYDSRAVVANARVYAALCAAAQALTDAVSALDAGFSADVAGLDIERAISALSDADGRGVSEEIVDEIFSKFCIGK